MSDAGRLLAERRRAREGERRRYDRLRQAHMNIVRLPADQRRRLMREAHSRIDQWERAGLCAQYYVDSWRALLEAPVDEFAQVLSADNARSNALLQNSPLSASIEIV